MGVNHGQPLVISGRAWWVLWARSPVPFPSPLHCQGKEKADTELLQRHSTDSAGAGKSRDGRSSATHGVCSGAWQGSKLGERRAGKLQSRGGFDSSSCGSIWFPENPLPLEQQLLLTHLPTPPKCLLQQRESQQGLERDLKANRRHVAAEGELSAPVASLGQVEECQNRGAELAQQSWGAKSTVRTKFLRLGHSPAFSPESGVQITWPWGRQHPNTAAHSTARKSIPHSPSPAALRGFGWQNAPPSPTQTTPLWGLPPTNVWNMFYTKHPPCSVMHSCLGYFLNFVQEEVPLLCQAFV